MADSTFSIPSFTTLQSTCDSIQSTVNTINTNVTALQTAENTYVPLSGGTMTGLLVLSGDPTAALGAATKQYVDANKVTLPAYPTTGGPYTLQYDVSSGAMSWVS